MEEHQCINQYSQGTSQNVKNIGQFKLNYSVVFDGQRITRKMIVNQ